MSLLSLYYKNEFTKLPYFYLFASFTKLSSFYIDMNFTVKIARLRATMSLSIEFGEFLGMADIR